MAKAKKEGGLPWGKKSASKTSDSNLTECIQKVAYELWEQKGRIQGKDMEIWLEAESLVKNGKR